MTPCSCTVCGARIAVGQLFDNPMIRTCKSCRDIVLTYLTHLEGVIVSDLNPLVYELCHDSHYLADTCYEFYDNITQTRGKVLRLRK